MKALLMGLFVSLTVQLLAQETEHLKGNSMEETQENNSIRRISSLRNALEVEVLAYPNPSIGTLTVTAPESSVITLYLENGVYVGTWNVDSFGQVELSDLPSGTMIMTIVKDSERTVKKIIVL
jgi:hypothetical protein